MNNIVFIIAMITSAISGYAIGAYQGNKAEEALSRVEAAAEQTKKSQEQAVKELTVKLESQVADYEREKAKIRDDFQREQSRWASRLAQRDRRIKELTAASVGTEGELARLRAQLERAETPAERERLNASIKVAEAELNAQKTLVEGLECSKAAVPQELLGSLEGAAP